MCGATWYLYLAHVFEKYADFVEACNLLKILKTIENIELRNMHTCSRNTLIPPRSLKCVFGTLHTCSRTTSVYQQTQQKSNNDSWKVSCLITFCATWLAGWLADLEAAGGSERAEYWIPVGFCSILRNPDFRLASWLAGPRELTTLLTPAWLPGCMAAWLAGCLAKTFPNLTYFSKESDGCECVEPIGICTWHTCSRNTPI